MIFKEEIRGTAEGGGVRQQQDLSEQKEHASEVSVEKNCIRIEYAFLPVRPLCLGLSLFVPSCKASLLFLRLRAYIPHQLQKLLGLALPYAYLFRSLRHPRTLV